MSIAFTKPSFSDLNDDQSTHWCDGLSESEMSRITELAESNTITYDLNEMNDEPAETLDEQAHWSDGLDESEISHIMELASHITSIEEDGTRRIIKLDPLYVGARAPRARARGTALICAQPPQGYKRMKMWAAYAFRQNAIMIAGHVTKSPIFVLAALFGYKVSGYQEKRFQQRVERYLIAGEIDELISEWKSWSTLEDPLFDYNPLSHKYTKYNGAGILTMAITLTNTETTGIKLDHIQIIKDLINKMSLNQLNQRSNRGLTIFNIIDFVKSTSPKKTKGELEMNKKLEMIKKTVKTKIDILEKNAKLTSPGWLDRLM